MQELEGIKALMDEVVQDTGVPRNIRATVEEAKEKLGENGETDVKIMGSIYLLDECLNDINMPLHTRTEMMSIISELERLKEQLK